MCDMIVRGLLSVESALHYFAEDQLLFVSNFQKISLK